MIVSDSTTLEVRKLRREYAGHVAVDDVSFAVERGGVTGLIGPNGAGKSTVLAMIAGALKPTRGRVLYEGKDVTAQPTYRLARRGLVRTFQLGGDFGRLTVLENMLVAALDQRGESYWRAPFGGWGWRRQENELVVAARALLARFGLADKESEYARELSGGQRRLLEVARVLMGRPRVLLLDEPMAGVNPALAHQLAGYLRDLGRESMTILMVEHELGFVEMCCDRVLVLAQGQVIASGTMDDVRRDPRVVDAYLAG